MTTSCSVVAQWGGYRSRDEMSFSETHWSAPAPSFLIFSRRNVDTKSVVEAEFAYGSKYLPKGGRRVFSNAGILPEHMGSQIAAHRPTRTPLALLRGPNWMTLANFSFLCETIEGALLALGLSWLITFGHDDGGGGCGGCGGAIGPRSLSLSLCIGFSNGSQQDVIGIDSNILTESGRI